MNEQILGQPEQLLKPEIKNLSSNFAEPELAGMKMVISLGKRLLRMHLQFVDKKLFLKSTKFAQHRWDLIKPAFGGRISKQT